MLPVTHGIEFTRLQILLYTVLLVLSTLLPYLLGMNGWLYISVAVVLGGWFLWLAVKMLRGLGDSKFPMQVFVFSINYLMVLFAAMLLDHYLQL